MSNTHIGCLLGDVRELQRDELAKSDVLETMAANFLDELRGYALNSRGQVIVHLQTGQSGGCELANIFGRDLVFSTNKLRCSAR